MTRKLSRNYSRGVVAACIAILILLIAAAVLAQTSGAGQTSGKSYGVPAQSQEHRLLSGGGKAERAPATRPRTARQGAGPMDSPPIFSPAVTYNAGDGVHSIVVADLNGDHKADVVVANSTGIAVLLGNGDGTLQSAVLYSGGSETVWWPGGLKVADLNRDGILDVVVANAGGGSNGDDSVGVLLGNGDGTFQPAVTYDSGGTGNIFTIVLADVNLDGKVDIILSNPNSGTGRVGTITVLLGNGDGTFHPAALILENGGTYGWGPIAVADLNKDGKLDLIIGGSPGKAYVLLGNGDGTLQPPVTYDSGGYEPVSLAIADVNADGNLDILVGNAIADSNIGVLLGNGDGTLQALKTFAAGGEPWSIVVADLDGDAKSDLLVADYSWNGGLGVLLGNGDGTFQNEVIYDAGGLVLSADVADLNGDCKPDAVASNGGVAVLLHANATTSTLVSPLNPSVFGQTVTFTASVSSDAGTPTGTVALFDGSNEVARRALANGSVAITVSSLAVGSHSITAAYQGGSGYTPSTSDPVNQIVAMATSTVSLQSSLNPVPLREYVAYTATVTSQYGGAVTGTVTFQDGGSTIATVDLNGSQAVFSTKYTATGIRAITAAYSGDQNNTGSASATLFEQVIRGLPSKTVLTTSGSPTFAGQPVTFTAMVTSSKGTIPGGEMVTFYDGATQIGTGTTTGGVATFTTSSLAAKTHTIKATYAGDGMFQPSTGMVTQVVNRYATATALSSSLNPSHYGQAVNFTATVTPSGPYPLTGKVKFWDGTVGIGTATLSGGAAILTKPKLAVGTHPITAQYLGDSANDKSTSSVLNQVVQ